MVTFTGRIGLWPAMGHARLSSQKVFYGLSFFLLGLREIFPPPGKMIFSEGVFPLKLREDFFPLAWAIFLEGLFP